MCGLEPCPDPTPFNFKTEMTLLFLKNQVSMIYNNNNKEFYHRYYVFLGEKMNCSMLCRLSSFFSELAGQIERLSARSPNFFFI
jgi:hypothetical protein